jgi:hypothetical protein
MTTHRCTCGTHLIRAEVIGRVLNPNEPLMPASVRKAMTQADISHIPDIPADRVHAYAIRRPGKGRWSHK